MATLSELLTTLEGKIAKALDTIQAQKTRIEALEQENQSLQTEHDKWRHDISHLISQFDRLEKNETAGSVAEFADY